MLLTGQVSARLSIRRHLRAPGVAGARLACGRSSVHFGRRAGGSSANDACEAPLQARRRYLRRGLVASQPRGDLVVLRVATGALQPGAFYGKDE